MTSTETTATDPRALPLRCTYCGGSLYVNQELEGSGHLSSEVVESIECDDHRCGATWEPDGTPRYLPGFVKHPDLYTKPDARGASQ